MDLADRYRAVRATTAALAAPLSPEDCALQSMEDASPVKWHMAHTTWFFETLVLEAPDYAPFEPEFRVLFNSYYNTVGDQYARPSRGLLSRPDLATVHAYRHHVDERILARLATGHDPSRDAVIELGLHHEQQHQELLLTDVKHALSHNPWRPAYRTSAPTRAPGGPASALGWFAFAAGLREIGCDGDAFAFDNERPRHRVFVDGFELASRPVTNAEYLAFMDDGGYRRPELWLSDGWARVQAEGWRAPLYWEEHDGAWHALTLDGREPPEPAAPVCHVSQYEADAFARWAGARLPTEAEWEVAAEGPASGNFLDSDWLRPRATPPADGCPAGLFGDVWEWTASAYAPYPGFRPLSGALAEYNGKFMSNQLVLRGGSCVTPAGHVRPSYRNFFYPHQRWQYSGIRLARDAR